MEIRMNELSPELFLELYSSAGWEPPCIGQVARALAGTIAAFTAHDGDKPVGMVRVIGDGGMSFYLKDFVVIPEYRSKGVGKLLIQSVENHIREVIKPDWAVALELISTIEAQKFYEKMGFEPRPCSWDGPGMFKMLRPRE